MFDQTTICNCHFCMLEAVEYQQFHKVQTNALIAKKKHKTHFYNLGVRKTDKQRICKN